MTTIDEFVEKDNIKVDMLKMDIEGEELKALYGELLEQLNSINPS
jgi:FkbM family methyltransferase